MINVSIVIPNLHSSIIDQTLRAIEQQAYNLAGTEVLVVGQDKFGLVRENRLVQFIRTPQPVPPAVARNIGIQEARGDLLCFTDADCIPTHDWLARLTAPFADEKIHVVGGGVTFEAKNYWTLCDNLSWFHDYLASTKEGERKQLPSLNLCVRRNVIEKIGFFNETYPQAAGEDAEWTTRMRQAGYVLHFAPEAAVHHSPSRASFIAILRHAYIYGQHSVKVNPVFADFLGVSPLLRRWWALLPLSPLAASVAALRIYLGHQAVRQYWCAFPGILLGKFAWTLGAVKCLYGWSSLSSGR